VGRRTGTRERLLEAAIDLIETDGEAGVRIDIVSEAAGVAKPSLYHFFGDREGLVVAALGERYRRSLDITLEDAISYAQSFTQREQYVELFRRNILAFGGPDGVRRRRERIQVMGSAATRPTLQAEVDRVNDLITGRLAELLEIGKQRGWITSPHSSESLAVWWLGLMNGRRTVDERGNEAGAAWDQVTIDAVTRLLFAD
jgi:AcrR family transcriptional regulator